MKFLSRVFAVAAMLAAVGSPSAWASSPEQEARAGCGMGVVHWSCVHYLASDMAAYCDVTCLEWTYLTCSFDGILTCYSDPY